MELWLQTFAFPGRVVNVAVDPDRERARQLVRGSAATFARSSAEARASDDRVLSRLAREYQRSNELFALAVLPELVGAHD